jgi:hypothetical protein
VRCSLKICALTGHYRRRSGVTPMVRPKIPPACQGRVVLANNPVFEASLKIVKIYNLFLFNFLIAAVCIFNTVVSGVFSPTCHKL